MHDFFTLNESILKFSGFWLSKRNSTKLLTVSFLLLDIFLVAYSVLLYIPAQLLALKYTTSNVHNLIKNLNMIVSHFMGAIKCSVWAYNRAKVERIMDKWDELPSEDYCEDFRGILAGEKRLKDKCTWWFVVSGVMIGGFSCLNSLLTVALDDGELVHNGVYVQELPYYSWIPWDHRKSRWAFAMAVIFQCFPVIHYTFIIGGFDTLFAAIMSRLTVEFKILGGALRTLRQRTLKKLQLPNVHVLHDPDVVTQQMSKELDKCIQNLQEIFVIHEQLESVFCYCILLHVLMVLVIFCTCLFLVSTVPLLSLKMLSEMSMSLAIQIDLFIYCYFGNRVTLSAAEIPYAIYQSDWLSCSTSVKKKMLFTMTRMQKPVSFTTGKFSPLTLSTFVTIGRASYSLFAVLKKS